MDCTKIGRLLADLRKEKKLTQQQVADALGVSNKTVSKWECGLGCPDLTLWSDLSAILGVEMATLMDGEIPQNKPDNGNLGRVKFYVCPICGSIVNATGSAAVYCCGRKAEVTQVRGDTDIMPKVEVIDGEYFVSVDHPMEKDHYLLFAACVSGDRMIFQRLYPEQMAEFRMPMMRGTLYLYCTKHGLYRDRKAFWPVKTKPSPRF